MRSLDRRLKKNIMEELECTFNLAIKEESFYISKNNLPIRYAFNMNTLSDSKLPSRQQIKKRSLVGYALRQWEVDCTLEHGLDPKQNHLYLKKNCKLCTVLKVLILLLFT